MKPKTKNLLVSAAAGFAGGLISWACVLWFVGHAFA